MLRRPVRPAQIRRQARVYWCDAPELLDSLVFITPIYVKPLWYK